MKIYFAHSKQLDYKNILYDPIRASGLNKKYEIIFPHEIDSKPFSSKDFIKGCDLIIAEVSFPATGLGIELGWASFLSIPVLCVYKKDTIISNSLKTITNDFIEYNTSDDLIFQMSKFLDKFTLN